MVDGILASCYADFHHDLAHFTMTPLQRFSEVIELIFGDESGFPVFVSTARELGIFLLPNGYFGFINSKWTAKLSTLLSCRSNKLFY